MDGTLLDDDKKLSKKTRDSIQELKKQTSIKFGIASGRALTSLLPLVEENGLLDYVDVIIANNGVDIYEPQTQVHKCQFMVTHDMIQNILDRYYAITEVTICFHNPGIFYAQRVSKQVSNILRINHIDVVFHPNHDSSFGDTPRVMLLFDPRHKERIKKIVNAIHIKGVRGMFSDIGIYEYVHDEVAKDVAIRDYVMSFNDTMEDVLAIGDAFNDIEMLQKSGIGIAMKNADITIQSYANLVSEYTNNEDGVAHILTALCKQRKKEGEQL